ncbi:hypothetical protein CDD82_453 [Ophiocordyceps australis]|uniref:Uncharacterized protein n=1 Tax=Ophiocordyceps australis TaxID=1399860 RepID=A0A2C5ZKI4_9HYPO|nr:hypothetical protein CDD82_453 [Ophiocordyceps australis]
MTANGDAWWLQGLVFKAKCVGSFRLAEVNKYAAVNMQLNRQRWPRYYRNTIVAEDWHWVKKDAAAKSLAVQPPGRPDACTHFKSLRIIPEFSSSLWSGTYDRVYLAVGRESLLARGRLPLAQAPKRGSNQPINVNLKRLFGLKTVAVADILPAIRILASPDPERDVYKTDAFSINNIVFEATCAGSNSTARVDNYSEGLRGKWLQRKSGEYLTEVFSGKGLRLEDWRWVQ